MFKTNPLARRLALACSLAAACAMPAIAADNWRAYTYNAVSTVTSVKGLNALLDAVQKETQGQLKVRLHLGGTLPIAATNITQAVGDNVVQMGDDAFFVGSVPVGGGGGRPKRLRPPPPVAKAWARVAPNQRGA